MSQAELPLSLISVAISKFVLAVPISFVLVPFAYKTVTVGTFPRAKAMFDPIDPFSIVSLSAYPCVDTLTADSSKIIVSQIPAPITESLIPLAMALVISPLTLIHSAYLIYAYALTMSVTIMNLTSIQRLLVPLYRKCCSSLQLLEIEKVSYHIIHQVLLLFFLFSQVLISLTKLLPFIYRGDI